MKKSGFTIAEILVTLGIIGVVAALTIPTFTSEYKKKIFSASLSAAVSNIENAMTTMIMKDNVNDLFETRAWKALEGPLSDEGGEVEKFMQALGNTMQINKESSIETLLDDSGYSNGVGNLIDNNRENISAIPNIGTSHAFYTKNGMIFFIYIPDFEKDPNAIEGKDDLQRALDNGIRLTETAAYISVDVNGDEKPNTIGRDIFFFILGSDGMLYPYGGKDVEYKTGESYTCANNRGMGCTAALINNNYKMDY